MAKKIRGRNEGSISQRPNGRWRGQISEKGKRISRDFKTKSEAQLWLRQMQGELEQGFDYQGSKISLKAYLKEWLETNQLALRPKTVYDYEMTLQKHVIPNLGDVSLSEINSLVIEKFYSRLVVAGVGIRTVRIVHSILHRAFEKAIIYGLLTRNPAKNVTLPRYTQQEMQVWDAVQVNQFLVAAEGSPFEALYHLAVKTGMRQGELLGLKWSDLYWVSGKLHVRRQVQRTRGKGAYFQEPKTRAGRRVIQLGQGTLQVLATQKERQRRQKEFVGTRWCENDLIFPSSIGTPMDARNLRLNFYDVLDQAGLPKIRFHDLRHTAASLLLNNGIPVIVVSNILGHSKPSITLDIYGHLFPVMQEEAAQLMDELVSPIKVDIPASINVVKS